MNNILFNLPVMHVLPTGWDLLNFYLNQPGQDPEWVHFVHERLAECINIPEQLAGRFQSFLNIELCTSTRGMIIECFKILFFGWEDHLLFIPSQDLDHLLRAALAGYEFDHETLLEILRSLCQDRRESPFYSLILESDAFHGFWEQQHNAAIEMHRRNEDYLEALRLADRIRELSEENQFLWNEIQRRGIINRSDS